ncbi:MAG: allantoate amidohydrolase [Planctomycetota bacterium]
MPSPAEQRLATPTRSQFETAQPEAAQFEDASARVMKRAVELAACTDLEGGLQRLFCSPAMQETHRRLQGWMHAAGMATRIDAAGNLIGRRAAAAGGGRSVLIGSHLDTVVNAGRFDGTLGVLLGLGLAELCQQAGASLPVSLDVIGFSEEEGIRYQSPYIGSRALAGDLRPGDPLLERLDDGGVRLADALTHFGCDTAELNTAAYAASDVAAFIEPHIEQGPVLEEAGLPLGVVTGVAGQTRACFRFTGEMGHAGTVPMALRKDPMPAAARFIVEVEQAAKRRPGLLATVGRLELTPNVANVIPAEVAVRLDLRHIDDSERETGFVKVHRAAMQIAKQAGIGCRLEWCEQQAATVCDAGCQAILGDAIAEEGLPTHAMASGAGHDAVVMANRFPSGILFLRCAGGVSHHPDESVSQADVATALRVLWRALLKIADREPQPAGGLATRA